ncbi:MAG: hypothetical protein NC126_11510, partial [Clostridium sp.]|nr:hypothetical protein [Clostridium sp.]
MGKNDDAMYRYLSDNDRFADLFNAVFFDGRQIEGLRKGKRKKRQEAGLPKSGWAERMAKEDRLHPVYTICF